MTDEQKVRAEFDYWWNRHGRWNADLEDPDQIEAAWTGWQAALSHASATAEESSTPTNSLERGSKLVAACCGREECGGECGNDWQGMIHADGLLAGIRDDGTVAGYSIETHYLPATRFMDHGDFLAIVMDDDGCDAETRITRSNLLHALGLMDGLTTVRDGLRAMKCYPDSLFSKWADIIDQAIAAKRGG